MNVNEKINEVLDEFTNPYDNEKTNKLIDKLIQSEQFEYKHIDDITGYLISKKGFCNLKFTYTQEDIDLIEKSIEEIKQ